MAVVQGIKEKVHLPIYDAVKVEPEKQLRDTESSSTLKFFMNLQNKTKLETNLQAAGLLPHYNTFEARAMRVVVSDLPPEFPEDPKLEIEDLPVMGDRPAVTGPPAVPLTEDVPLTYDTTAAAGTARIGFTPKSATVREISVSLEMNLRKAMKLLRNARENTQDRSVEVDFGDEDVTFTFTHGDNGTEITNEAETNRIEELAYPPSLSVGELEDAVLGMKEEKKSPPRFQVALHNGAGSLVSRFIYNTVTTLFVGEKEMIKMPTWFFPGGAGPYSDAGTFATHGEPNPTATFRFAEPIFIDKQQNFRVEIEVPDSDTLKELQRIYGPLFIWVVLDGYMTRDVQ